MDATPFPGQKMNFALDISVDGTQTTSKERNTIESALVACKNEWVLLPRSHMAPQEKVRVSLKPDIIVVEGEEDSLAPLLLQRMTAHNVERDQARDIADMFITEIKTIGDLGGDGSYMAPQEKVRVPLKPDIIVVDGEEDSLAPLLVQRMTAHNVEGDQARDIADMFITEIKTIGDFGSDGLPQHDSMLLMIMYRAGDITLGHGNTYGNGTITKKQIMSDEELQEVSNILVSGHRSLASPMIGVKVLPRHDPRSGVFAVKYTTEALFHAVQVALRRHFGTRAQHHVKYAMYYDELQTSASHVEGSPKLKGLLFLEFMPFEDKVELNRESTPGKPVEIAGVGMEIGDVNAILKAQVDATLAVGQPSSSCK